MKKTATQILTDFFGDDKEGYALLVLITLEFMVTQIKHKKRFEEILNITCSGLSIKDFRKAVMAQKEYFEKQQNEKEYMMSSKIETSGKVIKTLNDSPMRWLFIALYWANNFRDRSPKDIQKIYDHRIGNIALTFMLYSYKMKNMEQKKESKPHSEKFYTNLSVRLVRVIEILTAISIEKNSYLQRVYLNTSITDLASNFFQIQSENRFESNTIDITETNHGKSVMRYRNISENIVILIATTRLLRDGFLSDIHQTNNEYQQLTQLIPVGISRATSKRRNGTKFQHIHDVISNELIPIVMLDINGILNKEEKIEIINKKLYRRDSGDNKDEEDNTKHIPSSREQNQRNLAFSATFAKSNMFLLNDYNIPTTSLLASFIMKLTCDNEFDKFRKSLFIISCVMGAKIEDILFMIAKNKDAVITIKNNITTVKIDPDLFAKNSNSELLDDNKHTLIFELPHRMSMIVSTMHREYDKILKQAKLNRFYKIKFISHSLSAIAPVLNEKFISEYFYPIEEEILLSSYVKYIKKNIKKFKRNIVIKMSKTHCYLPHFINRIGGDLRTAKLATAVYTRNDKAKLAYTSTRTNAVQHSQYIKQYWNELGLDKASNNLINLPDDLFRTTIQPPIASSEFSGSSRAVNQVETKHFFEMLLTNIDNIESEDDKFNLISIYVRYAMTLLLGTREFENSANFSSYSTRQRCISINEKSQTLAMGVRYIPVCKIMNNILAFYQTLLELRGLEQNVYLCIDKKYKIYTPSDAVQVINSIDYLENKTNLKKYIFDIPTNTGRHVFSQKALDLGIKDSYINAFLGHYGKGEEQLGMWSTLNMQDYNQTITYVTSSIAAIYGVKELTC